MIAKKIELLLKTSVERKLNPMVDLPWSAVPPVDVFWMPEHLISIYGTPEYDELSLQQKKKLSQLEFCLVCSVSASGEKEVIANMVARMLKSNYKDYRKYFYHFVEEENNHIYMFAEFCSLYGQFVPILYSYAQGEIWEKPETGDLLTFCHVLIFEELGQGLNEIMAEDNALPKLVRAINQYHIEDEGRHISFGRTLVKDFAARYRKIISSGEWIKLQHHIAKYLKTRHYDYHNVKIYKEVGVSNAIDLRDRLIASRDEKYFVKSNVSRIRIDSLVNFLIESELLSSDYKTIKNEELSA